MSCTKPSSEGQMGSGESDDEFYNVKLPNAASAVSQYRETKKEPVKKVYSPPRTKVKYDYKFESSSDDDSDDASSQKKYKAESKTSVTSPVPTEKLKKEEPSNERTKLSQNTCKVVEKINEELKSMKNSGGNKGKYEKGDSSSAPGSSAKHIPTSTVGVLPPVVMVPPPMIVPQPPSVMAVGASGLIVPPPIGLGNQNVMLPPHSNMMNVSGNVIQGANPVSGMMGNSGSGMMGMGNTNMMNSMSSQGNMVGMPNDLLRLQGNMMGMTTPGNMMQMPSNMMNPPAVAGLCMTGNMLQMQGNVMGMQAPGGNIATSQPIISNPGNILGSTNSIITSPGGVMMNPANVMTVANMMNTQGNMMGNPGNMMLNMNSQTSRINFPGSTSNAGGKVMSGQTPAAASNVQMSAGTGRNAISDMAKHSSASHGPDARSKISDRDIRGDSSDRMKALSSKPPISFSPSDSDRKNWHGSSEVPDDDRKSPCEGNKPHHTVREIPNTFKNDGSFMEIFKKMSEANNSKGTSNKSEGSTTEKSGSDPSSVKKPPVLLSGIVGKRRGGRVLKTGLVKKVKKLNDSEEEKGPKDAWAMYMAEVKKYREASCEEEGKTRPLVK